MGANESRPKLVFRLAFFPVPQINFATKIMVFLINLVGYRIDTLILGHGPIFFFLDGTRAILKTMKFGYGLTEAIKKFEIMDLFF